MKINIETPVLIQKFMTEFSCIGSECEDDCCHGWAIPVEKKAFFNIKKLYKKASDEQQAIKDRLIRNRKAENDWSYGVISIKSDERCPLLNQDGLCDLHGKHGSNKLGWVCKDYPRIVVMSNGQVEQSMSLSCPEAARLCLLQPDSTELVEVDGSVLNELSGCFMDQGSNLDPDPYVQLRDDIRQVMQLLLGARQYDTNGRLYLLVYFAYRIDGFYHKNTTNFDIDKLSSEIERIADVNIHSKLVSDFHAQKYDPSLSISIVQTLISFRTDSSPEFNNFIKLCMGGCYNLDDEKEGALSKALLTDVISTYYQRRAEIEQRYWQRLEGYFHNYIAHYIFNKSHLNAPSLALLLRGLLILLNIVKFLFFLNPLLDPILADSDDACDKNDHEALLDKAIVQTCYLCSRSFEHISPHLMSVITQVLDEQGVDDLEHLSVLAKT